MSTIKPLDHEAVLGATAETGRIVTAEEATVMGGLGSAVAELVVQHHPVPMRLLRVPDVFAPNGSTEFLLRHFGLTAEGIAAAARSLLACRAAYEVAAPNLGVATSYGHVALSAAGRRGPSPERPSRRESPGCGSPAPCRVARRHRRADSRSRCFGALPLPCPPGKGTGPA